MELIIAIYFVGIDNAGHYITLYINDKKYIKIENANISFISSEEFDNVASSRGVFFVYKQRH